MAPPAVVRGAGVCEGASLLVVVEGGAIAEEGLRRRVAIPGRRGAGWEARVPIRASTSVLWLWV